jgi:hypothetical protein
VTPDAPTSACPAGLSREHEPLVDMHVGIVSTSLGGHGADSCPAMSYTECGLGVNYSNNDRGHLLSRPDPCTGGHVATYQDKGFLAWDPKQALTPPGEADMGELSARLKEMVVGVGQIGCGYESQLESWYRFLVDPEPSASIDLIKSQATPSGIDDVLLQQRVDFLRPDSVLLILLLSDENDCSIKEYGQSFYAAQLKIGNGTQFHLPRARSECAMNPNDPCCKSCGQSPGDCLPDPSCVDANGLVTTLTEVEDPASLRCFDQKRRFGIDFLYEIDRYVTALTKLNVPNRAGELVENPLFSTDVAGVSLRAPDKVFFGGIVGVPWQDIARDPSELAAGFRNADEMSQPVAELDGATTWDLILGDPASYKAPLDPHMRESIDPRSGANPLTGDAIEPPSMAGGGPDPISGHEYTSLGRDDLQYACIFSLPTPRDCTTPGLVSCDCKDGMNDNPLCDPADPANPTTTRTSQARAKAYPGLRELSLIKALGPQGVVGSICPKQLADPSAPDYGYRPFVRSLFDAVEVVLPRPPKH